MMNYDKLIQNIIDQIKEAQVKLGYVKETVRLYYPAASLKGILGIKAKDAKKLQELLENTAAFSNTVLGKLQFALSGGRIEVSIPPQGAEYVYREVPEPAFLMDIVKLFGENHHCRQADVCAVFDRYSKDYVCEKMPEGMDFDYVMYFRDRDVDAYYYCIREEMGHTIYHRFTKEDYLALLEHLSL